MSCSGVSGKVLVFSRNSMHSCLLMWQCLCLQSPWPPISAVYWAVREELLLLPQLYSLQRLRLTDGGDLLAAASSWWCLLVCWTHCEEMRGSHGEWGLNANLLLVNCQMSSSTKDENGIWVSKMAWKLREPGVGAEDQQSLRSVLRGCCASYNGWIRSLLDEELMFRCSHSNVGSKQTGDDITNLGEGMRCLGEVVTGVVWVGQDTMSWDGCKLDPSWVKTAASWRSSWLRYVQDSGSHWSRR